LSHPCDNDAGALKDCIGSGGKILSVGQFVLFGDETILQYNVSILHNAKRVLALNLLGVESLLSLLDNKGLDTVTIGSVARPDDNITKGAVSNPPLMPIEDVATFNFGGSGFETRGITSVVRFGKSKAVNFIKIHTRSQHTFALLFVSEFVNDSHTDSVVDKQESSNAAVDLGKFRNNSSCFNGFEAWTSKVFNLESIDFEIPKLGDNPFWETCIIHMLLKVFLTAFNHDTGSLAHADTLLCKVLIQVH
jgi:hypothetical protein